MADKNIVALLVTQQDRLVGILTERDYTRKVALKGKSSKQTAVKEIRSAFEEMRETVAEDRPLPGAR